MAKPGKKPKVPTEESARFFRANSTVLFAGRQIASYRSAVIQRFASKYKVNLQSAYLTAKRFGERNGLIGPQNSSEIEEDTVSDGVPEPEFLHASEDEEQETEEVDEENGANMPEFEFVAVDEPESPGKDWFIHPTNLVHSFGYFLSSTTSAFGSAIG